MTEDAVIKEYKILQKVRSIMKFDIETVVIIFSESDNKWTDYSVDFKIDWFYADNINIYVSF